MGQFSTTTGRLCSLAILLFLSFLGYCYGNSSDSVRLIRTVGKGQTISHSKVLALDESLDLPCYPNATKIKLQSNTGEQLQMFEVQVYSSGTNVAIGKKAKQKSTLVTKDGTPFFASNAVDGNSTTFSHTDCKDPWWYVDLDEMISIEYVRIVNRWCGDPSDEAGCLCRLSDASLTFLDHEDEIIASILLNNTCGIVQLNFDLSSCTLGVPTISPSFVPTYESSTSCPMTRYVKLTQDTTDEQLQMLEVQVFSSGTNVAIGKTARQKSTLVDNGLIPRLASYAVDGNLTTFCHTDCKDPWWMVDLGELMLVERVNIVNRWCGDPSDEDECLCKLSHAKLSLLDEQELVVGVHVIDDTCGQYELNCPFCEDAPSAFPSVSPTMASSSSGSPISFPSLPPTTSTEFPTNNPSGSTPPPSQTPSQIPSGSPSLSTSASPSKLPSAAPSSTTSPSVYPSSLPSSSVSPSFQPSFVSKTPSAMPSDEPVESTAPSFQPNSQYSSQPSYQPSFQTSESPSSEPSSNPSSQPSSQPSKFSSSQPSNEPSLYPSASKSPSYQPSDKPSMSTSPSIQPSWGPSTANPSKLPTLLPTFSPVDACSVQSIRIEATTNQPIHVFELRAFSGVSNVALSGTATQSSTYMAFDETTINAINEKQSYNTIQLGGKLGMKEGVLNNK